MEDLDRIKELCEELRHAKFNDLDKGALDPPTGELARHLWVGSNPELCKKILREFRGWSHRRNTGSLLTKVRKYLRENKILHEMVSRSRRSGRRPRGPKRRARRRGRRAGVASRFLEC